MSTVNALVSARSRSMLPHRLTHSPDILGLRALHSDVESLPHPRMRAWFRFSGEPYRQVRTHHRSRQRTWRARPRWSARLLADRGGLIPPIHPSIRKNTMARPLCAHNRLTRAAYAVGSPTFEGSSSSFVGTIGRDTSTPIDFIESRKMLSIAPWWRVTCGGVTARPRQLSYLKRLAYLERIACCGRRYVRDAVSELTCATVVN